MTQFDFYPAIPATNNSPSVDQPNMQTNNQSANDILAVDHITYNLPNGGTHSKVTLLTPLGSDPGGLTGTQAEVYTKSVSGVAQLFMQNSATVQQLTGYPISTQASSGTGFSGTLNGVQLPGGMKICYSAPGATATSASPYATYTFPFTYTTAPSVQVTANESSTGIIFTVRSITTTQCVIRSSGGTSNPITITVVGV